MSVDNVIAVCFLLLAILSVYIKVTRDQNKSEKDMAVIIEGQGKEIIALQEKLQAFVRQQELTIEPWPSRMDRMEVAIQELRIDVTKLESKK